MPNPNIQLRSHKNKAKKARLCSEKCVSPGGAYLLEVRISCKSLWEDLHWLCLCLQDMTANDVSNLMWASAVCASDTEALFSKMAPKLSAVLPEDMRKDSLVRVLQVIFASCYLISTLTCANLAIPCTFGAAEDTKI